MGENRTIYQKCDRCGNFFPPENSQCPYCVQAAGQRGFEADPLARPPARARNARRRGWGANLLVFLGIFTALLVVLVLAALIYSNSVSRRPTATPRPTLAVAPALVPSSTSTSVPTTTPTPVPNDEDEYVLWALYYGRFLRSDVNLLQENLETLYSVIELELEFEKTREKYGMGTRVPKEGETTFFDILDLNKKGTLHVLTFIDSTLSEIPKLPHPLSLEEEHMNFLEAKHLFDEGVKFIHSGYNILDQGKLAGGLQEFEKADQILRSFEESVLGVMKTISPGSVAYNDLFRHAERHKGRKVYYRGEVIQVIEDGNYFQLRVNITPTEYGWEDTVFLHYPDAPERVLEGDEISFVGRVNGVITYKSTMGASITIPELIAHELLIESE